MKQVVIVAPQFPPSNLTAGHRCRYFAMHLPKFGWKVRVLSVIPSYYAEKPDLELEKLLPSDLEIIRTKAFGILPFHLIGDIGIRAFWWHYRSLCGLAKSGKADLIYIPIPPNYSALLGYLIHCRFGIPYAIDYIDPWVHPYPGSGVLFSKAWVSYHLSRILEPLALRRVKLISAVAPGYYEGVLKRYHWITPGQCLAIPYGAEERDFKYLDENPRPAYLFDPSDGNSHIVYAGAMLPRAYSTLKALFEAILLLRKKYPAFAKKLRFHFIGTSGRINAQNTFAIKALAQSYGILDTVFEYPLRISYIDVLNHLRYASCVLILGSSEPHYTPSKVFPALLSRRPLIALLHKKSTAVDILKGVNRALTVTFDEKSPAEKCVNNIVEAVYNNLNNDYISEAQDSNILGNYSAEALTARLAEAFDRIV